MKAKWTVYLSLATVLLVLPAMQSGPVRPVDFTTDYYLNEVKEFTAEGEVFSEVVEQENARELVPAFVELRNAFKRVEFLMAYADPEWHSNYINGAPLPHLEPKTSGIVVLDPEGLQRMEELVYEEEINWTELRQKTTVLTDQLEHFNRFAPHHNFDDRKIFEAVRLELIRVLSQGITGFDTPGSDRAIVESAIAMSATRDVILKYLPELHDRNAAFADAFELKWNNAVQFLEDHPNFDTFDRATFTREYIEPLFKMTTDAQEMLYIEFADETTTVVQSVNARSRHIFSSDLINPFYFTQMREYEYSPELVELGRSLFFDPVLSVNVQRSCASCHKPEHAFTDGLTKSTALHFEGTVDRNAPTLVNAALSPRFFHDLRTERLETQFDHVILNPKEFNMSYRQIVDRLKTSDEYVAWFKQVYGENAEVNKRNIETAIASFIVSLNAFDSEVDQWLRGEAEVDSSVVRGYNLFMGKAVCGTCHFAPTFAGLVPPNFKDMESEVLGIPVDTAYSALDSDVGRAGGMMKERSEIYEHSFKTVTIRNIKLTGPYMHNGVFTTLDEIMDFYNNGGGAGRDFDVPNQTLPFDSLSLNDAEMKDIIHFMEALTDLPKDGNAPKSLPRFETGNAWNERVVGGEY